jgi:hypothetical protein
MPRLRHAPRPARGDDEQAATALRVCTASRDTNEHEREVAQRTEHQREEQQRRLDRHRHVSALHVLAVDDDADDLIEGEDVQPGAACRARWARRSSGSTRSSQATTGGTGSRT